MIITTSSAAASNDLYFMILHLSSPHTQLVQRTFETPSPTDLGGSPLIGLLSDVIADIDRILADPNISDLAQLGPDHLRRLLVILELVLSDIAPAHPLASSSLRPPSSSSSSLRSGGGGGGASRSTRSGGGGGPSSVAASEVGGYRIRTVVLAFLATLCVYIKDNLLRSARAYETLCKAVSILETLQEERAEGIDATERARSSASRSDILAGLSGVCPSFHNLPLSRELEGRIHAFVFGGLTHTSSSSTSSSSSPGAATSLHNRKPPAPSSLELFSGLSLPLGPDYEYLMEDSALRGRSSVTQVSGRHATIHRQERDGHFFITLFPHTDWYICFIKRGCSS